MDRVLSLSAWLAGVVVALLVSLPSTQPQSAASCNCTDCKQLLSGPYAGTYVAMGSVGSTGGCLYRSTSTGKIVRACDSEANAATGNSYPYRFCWDTLASVVCNQPPNGTAFGYDAMQWDGSRLIQTGNISYVCNPPKAVAGYNGSAIYQIFCSAPFFPNWQGWSMTNISTTLPLCL